MCSLCLSEAQLSDSCYSYISIVRLWRSLTWYFSFSTSASKVHKSTSFLNSSLMFWLGAGYVVIHPCVGTNYVWWLLHAGCAPCWLCSDCKHVLSLILVKNLKDVHSLWKWLLRTHHLFILAHVDETKSSSMACSPCLWHSVPTSMCDTIFNYNYIPLIPFSQWKISTTFYQSWGSTVKYNNECTKFIGML